MRLGITNIKCNQQTVAIQSLADTGVKKMASRLAKGWGLARHVQEESDQRIEPASKEIILIMAHEL